MNTLTMRAPPLLDALPAELTFLIFALGGFPLQVKLRTLSRKHRRQIDSPAHWHSLTAESVAAKGGVESIQWHSRVFGPPTPASLFRGAVASLRTEVIRYAFRVAAPGVLKAVRVAAQYGSLPALKRMVKKWPVPRSAFTSRDGGPSAYDLVLAHNTPEVAEWVEAWYRLTDATS